MTGFTLELTEDQTTLQKWLHEFSENVIRPAASEWDEREETPWPVIQEAAKAGIYSLDFFANVWGDDLAAGGDRGFGRHPRRNRHGPAAAALGHVAAQGGQLHARAGRGDRRVQPRHQHGHRGPRRLGGQLGHLAQPAAAEHRLHHPYVDRAQRAPRPRRRNGARPAGIGRTGGLHSCHRATSTAASGWAWSVSSPDSPVRMR